MSGDVFISYRRNVSSDDVRKLHAQAATAFGRERVFLDIDTLRAGEIWEQTLEHALKSCAVMIVAIGRRRLELLGRAQRSGERDFVVEEIRTALVRGAAAPGCHPAGGAAERRSVGERASAAVALSKAVACAKRASRAISTPGCPTSSA